MSAAGASTAVTALTTIVFSVTGINDKINKAAASVFGEDLVKIGNIFGAAYGAFSGGFGNSAGAASGAEAAESLNAVNGSDFMSDAFSSSGSTGAGGFGSLSDLSAGAESIDAIGGMDTANDAYSAANGSTNMENMAPSRTMSPMASGGQDLLNGNGVNGPEMVGMEQTQPVAAPAQTTVTAQGAAGQNAAAQVAAAPQQGAASTRAAGSGAAAAPTANRSFFDRLVYDDKGNVSKTAMGAIQGVGKGISDASAASTQDKRRRQQYEREMAEQQRRMNQRTNLRVTG